VPRDAYSAQPALVTYDILSGRRTIAKGVPVTVYGDDLSSAEAAIVLAQAGYQVKLCSPAADIAVDAHPGFRDVSYRVLNAAGAKIEVGVAEVAAADGVVVHGRKPGLTYESEAAWIAAETPGADAFIDDAYEPGAMTRGIYAAVELAFALDRERHDRVRNLAARLT
jgi:hypothetical protein